MTTSAATTPSYAAGWDSAHARFAQSDADRMEWLNQKCHLKPVPLTREERLRRKREYQKQRERDLDKRACAVCGARVGKRRGPGLLCVDCRAAGWTAKTCECGAPLHHADIASRRPDRCSKCRKRQALEDDDAQAGAIVVRERPQRR